MYFASKLVDEIGVKKSKQVGNSNTNVVLAVEDFHGFAFHFDTDMSEMGGNELVVTLKGALVIKVYWQASGFDVNQCKVEYIEDGSDWLKELEYTMKHKASILAAMRKEAKAQVAKESAEAARHSEEEALAREGERLGL